MKKNQDGLSKLKFKLQEHEKTLNSSAKGSKDYEVHAYAVKLIREEINRVESKLQIFLSDETQFTQKIDNKQAVILFFDDRRLADITEAMTAVSLQAEIEENRKATHTDNVGKKLEQHLLNLKTRRSLALTEDKDKKLADSIDKWFVDFEKILKHLFENKSTQLLFDPEKNKFSIQQDGKPPFTFQTLSLGYNAILDVYADLLMRTEYYSVSPLELEGIIFIDEIESHLHIALQRVILPFFIKLFPKIQYIVTTHSPFVIMSVKEALVFDLSMETLYNISKVKSHTEIINKYLGVPTILPIWAEES
jgi:predicted ATP-dependent endonuclease of OLD family